MEETGKNIIAGRNSVLEVFRSGRQIESLLVDRTRVSGSIKMIIAKARERGIPVKEVASQKLDFMAPSANHQGVIAITAEREYCSVDDILACAAQKNEQPFIIICDGIEDPHNLGAIIRTAEACGVHGIIIPKRRSAGLSFSVAKTASGALEYMNVARVTNLVSEMEKLKERGVWIFGADMNGTDWDKTDFTGPVAIVIGSEGDGIGRLVREHCDGLVSLPMAGNINSLNASVAAGIMMYEVVRQRR